MPIKEMIIKAIVSGIVKEGISAIKKTLENHKIELIVSQNDLEESIYRHNDFIINTTKFISFKELKGNKNLRETYIDLDIQLQAKRQKSADETDTKQNIESILLNNKERNHIVILGGPGAGKTTTVKHICQLILNTEIQLDFAMPLLINLRDINDSETIYSTLKTILGIEVLAKDKDKTFNVDNIAL